MFERSELESLRDVSVTRIGDTFSFGFPQTVLEYSYFHIDMVVSSVVLLDDVSARAGDVSARAGDVSARAGDVSVGIVVFLIG